MTQSDFWCLGSSEGPTLRLVRTSGSEWTWFPNRMQAYVERYSSVRWLLFYKVKLVRQQGKLACLLTRSKLLRVDCM